MPRLRRPPFTHFTDLSTGKRCRSTDPGAVRHRGRSKCWHGTYVDGRGTEVEVKLSPHKETARRMLAELQRGADLERVGLGDPYAAHRHRPLSAHVEEWAAALAAKGSTAAHCVRQRRRVERVLARAGLAALADLEGARVEAAVAALAAEAEAVPDLPPPLPADDSRPAGYPTAALAEALGVHPHSVARTARRVGVRAPGKGKAVRYTPGQAAAVRDALRGMGAATANHYLVACKTFTRWLARERRWPVDPLSHLARLNARADVRHQRRALPPEAFARLVEAAGRGRTLGGLTGRQRLVLYTLAGNTGLRAGELASLTPQSFDWQAPSVTVAAGVSKRRREDVLPLRPDVAGLLRGYCAGLGPSERLFPGNWHRRAADVVRADLEAAGIPYAEQGRVFDFHATRGEFITLLAAAGVHPRVAQELARHSDINLTMRFYTDPRILDVRGALDRLPPTPVAEPRKELG